MAIQEPIYYLRGHRSLDEDDIKTKTKYQEISEIFSYVLLFFLIFGMSGTVQMSSIKKQLRNRYAIATGITMQFIVIPLLGFISVSLCRPRGLSEAMSVTLLIVTASPGGSYSNWWCSIFNADLALSVTMTALSTLVSVFFLPANLMLYTHAVYGTSKGNEILESINISSLFISLSIVVLGICLGLLASYVINSSQFRRFANTLGSLSGLSMIVTSAIFSVSDKDGVKPWNQEWPFYVGVALPCVFGLLISNLISMLVKLEKAEVVTISVESCYQNVGIAASAVMSMFKTSSHIREALAVPLYYGLVEALILAVYCLVAWKLGWTKAPKDERLCVVLTKTYEICDPADLHEYEKDTDELSQSLSLYEDGDFDDNFIMNNSRSQEYEYIEIKQDFIVKKQQETSARTLVSEITNGFEVDANVLQLSTSDYFKPKNGKQSDKSTATEPPSSMYVFKNDVNIFEALSDPYKAEPADQEIPHPVLSIDFPTISSRCSSGPVDLDIILSKSSSSLSSSSCEEDLRKKFKRKSSVSSMFSKPPLHPVPSRTQSYPVDVDEFFIETSSTVSSFDDDKTIKSSSRSSLQKEQTISISNDINMYPPIPKRAPSIIPNDISIHSFDSGGSL